MPEVTSKEIDRQYRVLRQTLSIHAMLRDEFVLKSKAIEILLLICSVVFCAMTFASDELYKSLKLDPEHSHIVLGFASIIAFALSIMLMVLDYRGLAALHREAVSRWSSVLAEFRKRRHEDGTWPEEMMLSLDRLYWEADNNTVSIPEKRFNRLKGRYLRKVEISNLKSSYPGCPRLFISLQLRFRDTMRALKRNRSNE